MTPWTVARKAPLLIGFSRQEYWSGLPCPPPGDLPNPGTEPTSLTSPALASRFFTTSAPWEARKPLGKLLNPHFSKTMYLHQNQREERLSHSAHDPPCLHSGGQEQKPAAGFLKEASYLSPGHEEAEQKRLRKMTMEIEPQPPPRNTRRRRTAAALISQTPWVSCFRFGGFACLWMVCAPWEEYPTRNWFVNY